MKAGGWLVALLLAACETATPAGFVSGPGYQVTPPPAFSHQDSADGVTLRFTWQATTAAGASAGGLDILRLDDPQDLAAWQADQVAIGLADGGTATTAAISLDGTAGAQVTWPTPQLKQQTGRAAVRRGKYLYELRFRHELGHGNQARFDADVAALRASWRWVGP